MVLLERDEYLSLLTDGFEKTISGEGHCFFIMGEAGIGKSSLVRAFIEKIEGKSKTYIALCDSLFTPRPLGPLYDFALQMKNFDAAFISVAHSRSELFTSFAQELTQHNKPVVIIIEDIHWAPVFNNSRISSSRVVNCAGLDFVLSRFPLGIFRMPEDLISCFNF